MRQEEELAAAMILDARWSRGGLLAEMHGLSPWACLPHFVSYANLPLFCKRKIMTGEPSKSSCGDEMKC